MNMLVVAVTGGIGSGKSTVVDLFRHRGIPVIDTDIIAREVVQDPATLATIVTVFGNTILAPDGSLDRTKLRELAFASDDNRQKLNQVLHPLILARAQQQIEHTQADYCLLVIPLLYETKSAYQYHRVLVVDADPKQQMARCLARDRSDAALIQKIIAAQATREQRLSIADDVIDNNGSMSELPEQVEHLHQKYQALARSGTG
jgi:dephospho-CoA kinase